MDAIAAASPKNVPIRAFPGDPLLPSVLPIYQYRYHSLYIYPFLINPPVLTPPLLVSLALVGELTTVVRVTADDPQVLARMRVRLQRLFAGEKMVDLDNGQVLWHECFANKEIVGELEQVGKVNSTISINTFLVTPPYPVYLTLPYT